MKEMFYSVAEVAEMFPGKQKGTRCSEKTVREWIKRGKLKAEKVGRMLFVTESQINDFLLENET